MRFRQIIASALTAVCLCTCFATTVSAKTVSTFSIVNSASNIESRTYSSDYSYVNKENDINTYFPKSLKTDVGVSVEAQGQAIEMYPVSDVISQVTADNDLYGVYYDDVFGEFTGIRYEPSFSGYKI